MDPLNPLSHNLAADAGLMLVQRQRRCLVCVSCVFWVSNAFPGFEVDVTGYLLKYHSVEPGDSMQAASSKLESLGPFHPFTFN